MAIERCVADRIERDNRLISLPRAITTDDGRRIMVTAWNPRLAVDEAPTVVIEAIIIEADKASGVREVTKEESDALAEMMRDPEKASALAFAMQDFAKLEPTQENIEKFARKLTKANRWP